MAKFAPVNSPPKAEAKPKVKPEQVDELFPKVEETSESETVVETEEPVEGASAVSNGVNNVPVTPRKRGRKAVVENDGIEEVSDNDGSPTKKMRASPKKPAGPKVGQRAVPTSYDNASAEDKMLLRMKEEGKTWAEIREAWEETTGDKVGGSTLSGRYARIKANLVVFHQEDEPRLIHTLKEIEDKFQSEKWHRVADAIECAGGAKYPPTALQKKYKEIKKKMGDVSLDDESEVTAA